MTVRDARKLIGKKVCWLHRVNGVGKDCYGYELKTGILKEVNGRNVRIDRRECWLPYLTDFKLWTPEDGE